MFSMPIEIRPVMARVSALAATASRGESARIREIIDQAMLLAKQPGRSSLWNKEVDLALSSSLLKSALKVMQGSFGLTYAQTLVPDKFVRDESGTYVLKKGEEASQGLKTLLKGPVQVDCGGATKMLMLQALLDVLGEAKFNVILSHSETELTVSKRSVHAADPLDFFTLPAHVSFHSADPAHVVPGTCLYFQGIPWYGIKHPTGHGNGFWALYVEETPSKEPLYFALGFPKLVTEAEIVAKLVSMYNEPPSEESKEFKGSYSRERFLQTFKISSGHKAKLKGYEAEMEQCYESPDTVMTLEEGKAVGVGFFGYADTYRLASTILGSLEQSSIAEVQAIATPYALSVFHSAQHIRQLIQSPEDPKISKTTHQALNFIKTWG